jgi:cytochrome c biogenesis protein CcmG/thiol:disulfide interchange protein DsbE
MSPIIVVMHSDRFRTTALTLVLALAAMACGGNSTSPADQASTSAAEAAGPATTLPTDPRELPDVTPDSFDAMLEDVTAGRPAVVNFFGSWCGPCQREAPLFAEAARRYGEQVQFIGVDVLDTKEAGRRFMDEYDLAFPGVFDPSATGDVRTSYGFLGQPATLFIGYGGEEVSRWEGEIDADRLERSIRTLLPSA